LLLFPFALASGLLPCSGAAPQVPAAYRALPAQSARRLVAGRR
jgi:hypothetical protein